MAGKQRRRPDPFKWGTFSEKALSFLDTPGKRINLLSGAVRSSKTINSIIKEMEKWTREGPDGKLLVPGDAVIIGKTERTVKRNICNVIEAMAGHAFKPVYGDGEAWFGRRRIYLVGANDAQAESKIRGGTFAHALVDEATLIPEEFIKMLLSRLSVKGAELTMTTNPDTPFHWLKTEMIDNPDLDIANWFFTLDDNANLDPFYVENLKKEYTGFWYDRYILGKWVAAEGRIWDNFNPNIHVIDSLPADIWSPRNVAAIDYGTTNPTVCLDILDTGEVSYVRDSWRWDSSKKNRQLTDSQQADEIKNWYLNNGTWPEFVIIDPAASSFKLALKAVGFKVRDADNEVLPGIRKVASLLGRNLLYILKTPSNQDLVEEMTEYVWDPKAALRGVEQPIKARDHGPDALRYFGNTFIKDRRFKHV